MSMKVNRVSKTGTSKIQKTTPVNDMERVNKISFKELLDNAEDDHRQKEMLDEMMAQVQEKGQNLIESRTVESLFEYRDMVKGFVEEAVKYGLRIEERRGLSRSTRSKVLRVVSAVDKKLLELTDIILAQEESKIRILKKVGEIQGLLVNIYL
ncbi:MAG: YaaR family protein [Clostridia bacterium]|nr:YaaR family protein [Clostridia bacterium]